jgi:hypothetical protein
MLYGKTCQEVVAVAQSDGTAVTAAARTSLLPAHGKFTFPANTFTTIGQQLLITATGRISSVITTPGTARFDFGLGGTAVFDSLAILLDTAAAAANVGWWFQALLTLEVVGSAAKFFGQGIWTAYNILGTPATPPKGGLVAMLPWNSAPAQGAAFDATASLQADFNFTQTVGTGSCQLHQYSLALLN